ncbi:MAG: hypothetical protein ACLSHU_04485 [Oscillospiraceae bacterium]
MRKRKGHRLRRVMILLLILALGVFFLMRSRFNPIARDLAITQVTNQTSDLINDAIAEQIARDNIQYDRIIYFEKRLKRPDYRPEDQHERGQPAEDGHSQPHQRRNPGAGHP